MRITRLQLKNFKRFSDLTIEKIPDSSKLVLLIGSNGSGKSSVFDAFEYINKKNKRSLVSDLEYYSKDKKTEFSLNIEFSNGKKLLFNDKNLILPTDESIKFYGRSSLRIEPTIQRTGKSGVIETDSDSPTKFIDIDKRFHQDVFEYTKKINEQLREPVFKGEQADTVKIFETYIQPLNNSLHNIFGLSQYSELQLTRFEEEYNPPRLFFKKGNINDLNYDLLSHGEKQVIVLLLNFIVRKDYHQDSVYFIDEMDVHLNTRIQYRLLKEITEHWIPDDAQLWTASHALGFIEYANDYDAATIIDLNDMDFDKPQILVPADKSNYQIFEIAVSKEFIDKIFKGRRIVFSEGEDSHFYNDLSLDNTFFFSAIDKADVFYKTKNFNLLGLIDRDYLTDTEKSQIMEKYPGLKILNYYSIENLFYHPNNLEEYYSTTDVKFNINEYILELKKEKNNELAYIAGGIQQARSGYPFFKENENVKKLKDFKGNTNEVIDMLKSDDFEIFYKVFPIKYYGKSIPQKQNLKKTELSKTNWFKKQIEESLSSI